MRSVTSKNNPAKPLCKTGFRISGFTLVEIAVAIAILGIALGALLSLHTGYLSAALKDKSLTRAALMAKQFMTTIEISETAPEPGVIDRDLFEALKDANLITEDEEPQLKEELAGWTYHRTVEQIDLPEAADVMRRIDLTVQWGDRVEESYTLVYFMRTTAD